MAVDVMGNVLAVAVHSAGISESRGAHLVLIRLFVALPHLLKILVDGGYKQGVIDWGKSMFGHVLELVKRPELHKFERLTQTLDRRTNLRLVQLVPPSIQRL